MQSTAAVWARWMAVDLEGTWHCIRAVLPDLIARRDVEVCQATGRLCRPQEVAAVAVLLASDEARFMIGENVVIGGGVSIRMYEDRH